MQISLDPPAGNAHVHCNLPEGLIRTGRLDPDLVTDHPVILRADATQSMVAVTTVLLRT